jgi:hypothetical protein
MAETEFRRSNKTRDDSEDHCDDDESIAAAHAVLVLVVAVSCNNFSIIHTRNVLFIAAMDLFHPDAVIERLRADDPVDPADGGTIVSVTLHRYSTLQLTQLCAALVANVHWCKVRFAIQDFIEHMDLEPLLLALQNRANLRKVVLIGAPTSPATSARFLEAAAMNSALHEVVLFATLVPVEALISFLQRKKAKIDLVDVCCSRFLAVDDESAAAELAIALGECQSLKRLDIGGNDSLFRSAMVQWFQQSPRIFPDTIEFVGKNQLARDTTCSTAVAELAASALGKGTSVRFSVKLSNYQFSGTSFAPIAQAAIEGPQGILWITNCIFDAESTRLFESMVASPSKLTWLFIGTTQFHNQPMASVISILVSPESSLVCVSLTVNELPGVTALMGALETNTRLEYLIMDCTHSRAVHKALLRGIPKMTGLRFLILTNVPNEAFNVNAWILALRRNISLFFIMSVFLEEKFRATGTWDDVQSIFNRNKMMAFFLQNPNSVPFTEWHGLFETARTAEHGLSWIYQAYRAMGGRNERVRLERALLHMDANAPINPLKRLFRWMMPTLDPTTERATKKSKSAGPTSA